MRGRAGHAGGASSTLSLVHGGVTSADPGGTLQTGWEASPLSTLSKAEVRGSAGLDHVEITSP